MNRRAVAPIVAALLAIIIAVSGGATYYVFVISSQNQANDSTITSLSTVIVSLQNRPPVTVTETSASTVTVVSYVTLTSSASTSSLPVYAVIDTSQGVMEAELFPSAAPKTVANFVNLANQGFYNDLVWHRIVAGFAIQTGDPNTRNGGGNRGMWGTGGLR